MKDRPWGNEYRTTIVCVDAYDGGVPAGRFYNPYLNEGVAFSSLMDFLSKMDRTLDEMTFPQSFSAARSFSAPPEQLPGKAPEELQQVGKKGTFALKILFRQNASWQGSVSWLEGKREESFRSVLELVFLMDSALRGGE